MQMHVGRRSIASISAMSLLLLMLSSLLAAPARAANPAVLATLGTAITAVPTVDMTALTAPVTMSSSPALPSGLSLDAGDAVTVGTGQLSGTPTAAAGLATYTITATDSSPSPVVRTFVVDITVTNVTPPADVTAAFGQPLTGSPTVKAEGFGPGLAFALTGAPAWLSISATGVLSGTPTAVLAPTLIAVNVTDTAGASGSTSFTLTVLDALSPPTQSVSGVVGQALSPTSSPLTSSVAGTLSISPAITTIPGLSFDAATGVISGTPSKPCGPTPFTVLLTPSGVGTPLQATVTVSVDAVLGATAQAVTGTVGTAIIAFIGYGSAAATTAGLVAPFAYSTTPALPGVTSPGDLTINPTTGAITGRPTTAVVGAKYTVNVTDKNGAKASGPITVTIGGQILPLTQFLNASVGTSTFSRTLTASGMTAPITYSITPALPSGLVFNSTTGVVSGTPRAVQATTLYDISAADANGATGSAKVTVTVIKAPLSPPIIGSVVGGPPAGSLQVFFTAPRLAPTGQTYTVQVFDVLGVDLVTSVDATSSPVLVTGLTPGDSYQVVVVANATSSFDRVESTPKTGVASLTTTTATATALASAPAAGVVNTAKATASTLSQKGFVLAVGTRKTSAKKVALKGRPAGTIKKAPVVRIPANSYSRITVSGVTATGLLTIRIQVSGTWITLGAARPNAKHQLRLPAFAARNPGTYPIQITGATGGSTYVKLVVKKAASAA